MASVKKKYTDFSFFYTYHERLSFPFTLIKLSSRKLTYEDSKNIYISWEEVEYPINRLRESCQNYCKKIKPSDSSSEGNSSIFNCTSPIFFKNRKLFTYFVLLYHTCLVLP